MKKDNRRLDLEPATLELVKRDLDNGVKPSNIVDKLVQEAMKKKGPDGKTLTLKQAQGITPSCYAMRGLSYRLKQEGTAGKGLGSYVSSFFGGTFCALSLN